MRRLFMMVATSIQLLLDIVLPRKERTIRTEKYALEDIEVSPAEHEACGIAITSLLSYRETAVEDLIRAVKYDGSHHAAGLLADILAEYLREEVASIRSFSVRPVVLVPLPLHPNRLLERGFNQIEFIMDKLPVEFHDGSLAQIGRDVLLRVRETAQQTHLNRVERLLNVLAAGGTARIHLMHRHHSGDTERSALRLGPEGALVMVYRDREVPALPRPR